MRKKDLGGKEQEGSREEARDGEKSADVKWADPLTALTGGENSCGENYAKKSIKFMERGVNTYRLA